jgi:uncharacterized membrane protein YuzA (DUF378 family)
MDCDMTKPSLRKPLGILLIMALIAVWTIGVLVLSDYVAPLHWSLQAIFYTIVGIAWIFPMKPLLRWMERSRKHD